MLLSNCGRMIGIFYSVLNDICHSESLLSKSIFRKKKKCTDHDSARLVILILLKRLGSTILYYQRVPSYTWRIMYFEIEFYSKNNLIKSWM